MNVTGGRTDGQTDGQTPVDSLGIASRGKNVIVIETNHLFFLQIRNLLS